MKKLLFSLSLLILSCQNPSKITDQDVMNAFDNFFNIIDNNLSEFSSVVSNDFYIFENSRKYSTEEFIEFVSGFNIIETKRDYKDVIIETDYNSAHITLTQFGEFIVDSPEGKIKMNFEWLESAYLVKKNGILKFKFYFSETINNSTSTIVE